MLIARRPVWYWLFASYQGENAALLPFYAWKKTPYKSRNSATDSGLANNLIHI